MAQSRYALPAQAKLPQTELEVDSVLVLPRQRNRQHRLLFVPRSLRTAYSLNGEDVRQVVRYAYKAAHYGDHQTYFVCPNCFRRCLVLYGGRRFYCRKCWHLTYSSQYEQPFERARTRAGNIRARLGDPGMFNPEETPFPDKPKWMRWPTYWRLFSEAPALCREYEAGFVAGAMKIIGRARTELR